MERNQLFNDVIADLSRVAAVKSAHLQSARKQLGISGMNKAGIRIWTARRAGTIMTLFLLSTRRKDVL
jgi:hypothetical protein